MKPPEMLSLKNAMMIISLTIIASTRTELKPISAASLVSAVFLGTAICSRPMLRLKKMGLLNYLLIGSLALDLHLYRKTHDYENYRKPRRSYRTRP